MSLYNRILKYMRQFSVKKDIWKYQYQECEFMLDKIDFIEQYDENFKISIFKVFN